MAGKALARASGLSLWGATLLVALLPASAHASLFQGEQLDSVANAISWVVLFVAPVVVIAVFWMVHILPEKIAEKKKHPQTHAIHTLCILSLFFGGLLWPFAFLWAYTKPVFHKMAYGTDRSDELVGAPTEEAAAAAPDVSPQELQRLRERVDRLSMRVPTQREVDEVRADLESVMTAHEERRKRGG
jgi:hypothetical protein